jgi:hypothetical protein
VSRTLGYYFIVPHVGFITVYTVSNLFNDAVSSSAYHTASNDWMMVNNELEVVKEEDSH